MSLPVARDDRGDACGALLMWVDDPSSVGHECSWSAGCAEDMAACPNCGGGLGKRPRRTRAVG